MFTASRAILTPIAYVCVSVLFLAACSGTDSVAGKGTSTVVASTGAPSASANALPSVMTTPASAGAQLTSGASTSGASTDSGLPSVASAGATPSATGPTTGASAAPPAPATVMIPGPQVTEVVTVTATAPPAAPAPGANPAGGGSGITPNSYGALGFQSPSGNINCLIQTDPSYPSVRCDIGEFTYAVPAHTSCGAEIGWHAGTVSIEGAGVAELGGCIGDTISDANYPVLGYGQSVTGGNFTCASAENGMTCKNLTTGRGFRLAKSSYTIS
ncbi:hypothetical protein EH165_07615 [Nakamurella antarctica]|uniref:Uncharacterized protein n=1 Tax=Nakamurella antarctica TaxID=1902245 RepID=A0A3G8ZMK4_9ACTN|nr:DUF6636 domain-containing protein [Nakamurella antarctica]AZI58027.1 hypothetical protein EH165_07615 [Nakamurella antarctica]